jgi:triacylglycerol esterase/lipase EstA (alpha/beta hydrolase family)
MEKPDQIVASSHADALIVLLHAYTLSPDSLSTVADAIRKALPRANIIKPSLPLGRFSFADPVVIARDLVLRIDKEFEEHDYKRIILVGHSVGGLLARKAYLLAWGQNPDAPLEGDNGIGFAQPRPWVDRIERIILLAGMNRGWSVSHHMVLANLFIFSVGHSSDTSSTAFSASAS